LGSAAHQIPLLCSNASSSSYLTFQSSKTVLSGICRSSIMPPSGAFSVLLRLFQRPKRRSKIGPEIILLYGGTVHW
jgi:hypothetical protein